VLPLRDALASESEAVVRAARIALDEVQNGLADAPGALSLTEGETGALSMAGDEAGRVSLPVVGVKER
jgi:hypothetical protein